MKKALKDEWWKIPADLLKKIYSSMPERLHAVICTKERHTIWQKLRLICLLIFNNCTFKFLYYIVKIYKNKLQKFQIFKVIFKDVVYEVFAHGLIKILMINRAAAILFVKPLYFSMLIRQQIRNSCHPFEVQSWCYMGCAATKPDKVNI